MRLKLLTEFLEKNGLDIKKPCYLLYQDIKEIKDTDLQRRIMLAVCSLGLLLDKTNVQKT